ncbi:MAG: DNA translocase FtsK 4TM domain-containing protein [Planctomycetota bacterium]|nr:DNA translocase FtsK 4TM domain-containing protein [Planctomycetota bacterium]MDA1105902.1 DNA translocase FtsK 4TM domain-containing protein [Planctomycetota bacterium]
MARLKPKAVARLESIQGFLPPATATRKILWLCGVFAWTLTMASLMSFDRADLPSSTVAVQNATATNWVGSAGAALSWALYEALGIAVWLPMLAIGAWLVVVAMGRRLEHPVVRLVGLLLVTVAFGGLNGLWAPTTGPVSTSPAGLANHWIVAQLWPRFAGFGTSMWLLFGLMVGAVVAADELVRMIPPLVRRALEGFAFVRECDWAETVRSWRDRVLPQRKPALALAGGGSTFTQPTATELEEYAGEARVIEEEDVDSTDAAGTDDADDDEIEADHDEEPEDWHDEAEAEEWLEDDLEEDAEVVAADAGEVSEDATATPRAPLSADELKERLARLPVRMSGKNSPATLAPRDEDIPREVSYDGYRFPTLDLLDDPEANFNEKIESFVREQAGVLTQTLRTYQLDGEVVSIESGPVVTLYSVELAAGTRVARLETIAKDIARALSAHNIRIIPNMVGTTAVGIEVPNRQKEKVRLKELMSGGHAEGMRLPMFLGKDSAGEPLVLDLTRMPHMLIAGTTGSGKSVCMNSIIMSWIYTKRPDELKLVLVDPKMVEMSQFAEIPHLMVPVVTDMNKAAGILEWTVHKMEERYELFRVAGVRDIHAYNDLAEEEKYEKFGADTDEKRARVPKRIPFMVFVVDELADLMLTNREVEHSIIRIAQKARAVGIHLILATQRPQANVVTGLIKANMPCRIGFKVASGMDSRIVLDQKGAELLLGQGDMMVLTPSTSELRRAQGTFVLDGEIRKACRFLKDVAMPNFERSLLAIRGPGAGGDSNAGADGSSGGADGGGDERDPLFDKAVEIMIESGRGSVSLLQRRMAVGYGRASRLVDQMGAAGILSDHKGSVAREVLITLEDWQRMKELEASGVENETADPVIGRGPMSAATRAANHDTSSAFETKDGDGDAESDGSHWEADEESA